MSRLARKRLWRVLYLIVFALTVCQAGCLVATAGLVAGGAVGAAYVYSRGWYYHDFAAPLEESVTQARTALTELHMPLLEEKPNKDKVYLVSRTGDDRKVKITLESVPSPIPAEGFMTRVWVRVTYLGDEAVSTRILDQMSQHLRSLGYSNQAPPSPTPAPPGAPAPLQPVSASQTTQSAEPPLPASPVAATPKK
jgi:hypothetical protein